VYRVPVSQLNEGLIVTLYGAKGTIFNAYVKFSFDLLLKEPHEYKF
jgi:hypothetical protein